MSGKGGVGKTLQAVGIAASLAKNGYRVGILDLDIRSPNLTYVLGADNSIEVDGGNASHAKPPLMPPLLCGRNR